MFKDLMRMLKGPEPPHRPDLHLSVAVLLLESARQDDTFDAKERALIEKMLVAKFSLTQAECAQLMAAGEERAAYIVQLHGHTSEIVERMAPDHRIGLIEMLWQVAYADGVLDPEEDLLVRRVAGLIYVTDRDRVLARQRVRARLGHSEP
jgi:uncharacterized tellurite resistance protein B-like protein